MHLFWVEEEEEREEEKEGAAVTASKLHTIRRRSEDQKHHAVSTAQSMFFQSRHVGFSFNCGAVSWRLVR